MKVSGIGKLNVERKKTKSSLALFAVNQLVN